MLLTMFLANMCILCCLLAYKEGIGMDKAKLIVSWVIGIVVFALMIWMFISFVDTNIHNGDINYHYSNWNFFNILVKAKGV